MGGYYPVGMSMEESNVMMRENPEAFKEAVFASLRRQVAAINALTKKGMKFWDYGNSFLLQSGRAGADIFKPDGKFLYPSYVEDIMGGKVQKKKIMEKKKKTKLQKKIKKERQDQPIHTMDGNIQYTSYTL